MNTIRYQVKTLRVAEDIANEVLYVPPMEAEGDPKMLIYFGGDVQDFRDHMIKHRDNHKYQDWCLEATSQLLSKSSPGSHILIIKPSVLELGTFSCYHNFVESNKFGAPTHSMETTKAWHHLRSLLLSLQSQTLGEKHWDQIPKTLVGFSKGTVVLNQLLIELAQLSKAQPSLDMFANSVEKWCWLDGGHSGGKLTWITQKDYLEHMVLRKYKVEVRVTPYQVNDGLRPWIKQEEKRFSGFLGRSGLTFRRAKYFEEEAPSIANHFRILHTLVDEPL
ncbi:hypothetical protein TCAL_11725 [Tigriopus californicus]|uniref:DUF2235 domain-containing protein n=2 Tax=Tigriopus californicus TaxID=6832 RepID=A0A553NFY0_TIGCA|nr:hypothetical protein TCAL_11725 [Tigriopus californicus]|eukprot:TCALIF_11725-PA protein Name:"Similar to zgc:153521 UPF0565 protein C2orf69 homolog (Danio rerio)" AED:0.03 eAED:0.03 QI:0/-1/0/1/-1/1/1/0/276